MKLSYILCALSLVLTPSLPAKADPDPVVKKLMDKPVSMWTYGLDKLESTINSVIDDVQLTKNGTYYYTALLESLNLQVNYDEDKNRIVVLGRIRITPNDGIDISKFPDLWKEMCEDAIRKVKEGFITFSLLIPSEKSMFAYAFSEEDNEVIFLLGGEAESLAKITDLKIKVAVPHDENDEETACIMPLTGEDVFYSK